MHRLRRNGFASVQSFQVVGQIVLSSVDSLSRVCAFVVVVVVAVVVAVVVVL